MELHLAILRIGDPGDILQLDQQLLLHPLQRGECVGGRVLVGIRDDCQGAHDFRLVSFASPPSGRTCRAVRPSRPAMQP